MKKNKKKWIKFACLFTVFTFSQSLCGCGEKAEDVVTLRVSNWEEYIDEGEWEEEDAVELDNGTYICPQNSMIQDFEEWYEETYGTKIKVEYSTFGTNEELYNQLSMGDVYDLVCPSEYMIMKMIKEDMVVPFSEQFYNKEKKENYYVQGVSPYISGVYDSLSIDGEALSKYAAGYMWGTLGIVYNPEYISEEEASHWDLLLQDKYKKRVTLKDSVRDAYFAGNSVLNREKICSEEFLGQKDYKSQLESLLNATDQNTINQVEEILSRMKENVYSFETDSGKADMVTGKVVANQQWSGDAVYTLDQAEEDGVVLCYSAPEEATNLWFDGWCMLKEGIQEDEEKQKVAEAFINYLSRPDNAIRNMEYIGYTSVISGGENDSILQYVNYNYATEEEEGVPYPIGYFFTGQSEQELSPEVSEYYTIMTSKDQLNRQLFSQYPTEEVMERSVVMAYFDKEGNERINQMWLNIRCFDLYGFFQ